MLLIEICSLIVLPPVLRGFLQQGDCILHTPSGVRAWEFLSHARQAAVAEDTETPEQHAQRRLVGSLAVQGWTASEEPPTLLVPLR